MFDNPWLGTTLLKPIDVILEDHIDTKILNSALKVDVIIPIFNEMLSIESLVASLSEQTLEPSKVIFVDGGSNDGTWKFLKKYCRRHSTFQLHQLPGQPPAQAMNYAMRLCDGDLAIVMNAGCRYQATYLEQFALAAEKYPAVNVFSGTFEVENADSDAIDLTIPRFDLFRPEDWQNWLPSVRSFCLRLRTGATWPDFPEWLSFAGEDTARDILIRNQIGSWVVLTNPTVKWFAPNSQQDFQSKWSRYFRGDGESGARDPYLYPLAMANPRDRFLCWYWIGYLDRPFIDVSKRKIRGVFFYCSSTPLASSSKLEIINELIDKNFRIIFVPIELQYDLPPIHYSGDFTLTTLAAPIESEIVQLLKTYSELGVKIFSTAPVQEKPSAQEFYANLIKTIAITEIDKILD